MKYITKSIQVVFYQFKGCFTYIVFIRMDFEILDKYNKQQVMSLTNLSSENQKKKKKKERELWCVKNYWMSDKQYRPLSDAAFCNIWSSTLFAQACLFQCLGFLQYSEGSFYFCTKN